MALTLAPTINTVDPTRYKAMVETYHTFARRVQIDVSDNTLSPAQTIPPSAIWWPKDWAADIHMMVARPSMYLDILLKLHPSLVILHSESEEDLLPVFATLKKADIKTGVVFLKQTYPGRFKQYLTAVDHALVFAGDFGHNGGAADYMQLEKVRLIRKMKKDLEIGWDGGANMQTVRTIAQGNVNIINIGEALATAPDPAAMFRDLNVEADTPGVYV